MPDKIYIALESGWFCMN